MEDPRIEKKHVMDRKNKFKNCPLDEYHKKRSRYLDLTPAEVEEARVRLQVDRFMRLIASFVINRQLEIKTATKGGHVI